MKAIYPLTHLTYKSQELELEGLILKPEGSGPFPTIIYIHGFNVIGGWDSILMATYLVKDGYAVFLPSQMGFGNSKGERDYCGPKTVQGVFDGVQELLKENYIDKTRLGIWGFSRGSNVTASLISKHPQVFKAAVLQSGLYNFRKVLETTKDRQMASNMGNESGNTEEAFSERSAIEHTENITCPLLILHGGKDETYPIDQTLEFERKLSEMNKEHTLKIYADADHLIPRSSRREYVIPFFNKYLSN
ncbi:MAG: alpha/beta fold hydrolase [Patescibacteria group bacterium]